MARIVPLGGRARKRLVELQRWDDDARVRVRALIILLLSAGCTWETVVEISGASTRTIARWKRAFERGGVDALCTSPPGRKATSGPGWWTMVIGWVLEKTPRDFGFLRSRWCCATVCVLLLEVQRVRVSPETVRRWLHRADLAWRRPRPVLRRVDPDRPRIVRDLRRLLRHLPANELAVFQDEVDIHTNPKIGAAWMRRGEQAELETPGDNEKRYLAGSLAWNRPGVMLVTEGDPGQGRNAALFVRHLEDLRREFGSEYRVLHVICDNAVTHRPNCRLVRQYLAEHGDQIVLHYLPKRAPETNPIERVWWHLHEEITRNHRAKSMEELLDLVFSWMESKGPFAIEGSFYPSPPTAQDTDRAAA